MCSHQLSVPLAGLGPLTQMIDLSASGHHIQTLGSEFPSFADQGITGADKVTHVGGMSLLVETMMI